MPIGVAVCQCGAMDNHVRSAAAKPSGLTDCELDPGRVEQPDIVDQCGAFVRDNPVIHSPLIDRELWSELQPCRPQLLQSRAGRTRYAVHPTGRTLQRADSGHPAELSSGHPTRLREAGGEQAFLGLGRIS